MRERPVPNMPRRPCSRLMFKGRTSPFGLRNLRAMRAIAPAKAAKRTTATTPTVTRETTTSATAAAATVSTATTVSATTATASITSFTCMFMTGMASTSLTSVETSTAHLSRLSPSSPPAGTTTLRLGNAPACLPTMSPLRDAPKTSFACWKKKSFPRSSGNAANQTIPASAAPSRATRLQGFSPPGQHSTRRPSPALQALRARFGIPISRTLSPSRHSPVQSTARISRLAARKRRPRADFCATLQRERTRS